MTTAAGDLIDDDGIDPRFDAFLEACTDPTLPDDIASQIRAGLTRQYRNPPVEATEAVLRCHLMNADRVRGLVYWPDEDDAGLYVGLIRSPPAGAPASHPAAKCQVTYLMALYLKHAKDWAFAKPFILAGGLRAVADLVVHPNLHLRGQAMEALSALTNEELFAWHEPPRPNTSDVALHHRMLELARSPLIPNLTANFDASFPGGSHVALQILAFYASWLRLRHCPGNVLRLSGDLIGLLERWAEKSDGTDEERALARALHDDFSRYDVADAEGSGGAEALPAPTLNGAEAVAAARHAATKSAAGAAERGAEERVVLGMNEHDACRVVADRTVVSTRRGPSSDTVAAASSDTANGAFGTTSAEADADTGEEHKKRGNDAYARGDWTEAIRWYSAAIDAPVSYQRLFDEAPRRATYHANRAAAYLARGGAPGGGHDVAGDEAGHLEAVTFTPEDSAARAARMHAEAALLDCESALEMQPGHVKAKFRKATALHRLGRPDEARAVASAAVHGAPIGSAMEAEAEALLRALDEPWTVPEAPAESGVAGLERGVEVMGAGLLASMAESGSGEGGLLAAAAAASRVEEDARASFVSEAASGLDDAELGLSGAVEASERRDAKGAWVYGSEQPGASEGAAAGVEALGLDGDDLYDLD